MIARYTHPEMGRIWSDQRRYETWLLVETAAAEAMASAGIVPPEAARDIRERGGFDIARIEEIERTTQHGVHAEPMTFGLKLALWYAELQRDIERVRRARTTISVRKLSGAVGTYAPL